MQIDHSFFIPFQPLNQLHAAGSGLDDPTESCKWSMKYGRNLPSFVTAWIPKTVASAVKLLAEV
jgi:hypothetical protein